MLPAEPPELRVVRIDGAEHEIRFEPYEGGMLAYVDGELAQHGHGGGHWWRPRRCRLSGRSFECAENSVGFFQPAMTRQPERAFRHIEP